ncbi:hypothetical protein ER308_08930 [Egibacter rhizosphaerae]|uniref:Uncharacterized protein n=1 Tax=Egibacter rhizosphaerae TaxID=1670831 RepID=A0A411YEN5_9ACTN|nr:hypothetical protein [Egibacter rhizosphaerae]QBI19660.1 hypothetical protein ER308_08930 [Egibacter rhizosphaerae]
MGSLMKRSLLTVLAIGVVTFGLAGGAMADSGETESPDDPDDHTEPALTPDEGELDEPVESVKIETEELDGGHILELLGGE